MERVAPAAPRWEYAGRDLEASACAPRYHAWIGEEFAPFVRGDVAEVGAGTGVFSRELLALPRRSLTLYEPCTALRERLCAALRDSVARVEPGTLGEAGLHSAFDTLVYVNVLEHILDDEGELAVAHAALRPAGHLCLFVPALPWLYARHDRDVGHQRRYRRGELHAKLRRAGFDVERLTWFDAPGVLAWALYAKLLARPMRPASSGLYDRLVIPWLRPLERRWRPPLGKNLLAVARRA